MRSVPTAGERPMTLDRYTLWRVFYRSLFLQASWNPRGMQNLGLAYALYPALKTSIEEEVCDDE